MRVSSGAWKISASSATLTLQTISVMRTFIMVVNIPYYFPKDNFEDIVYLYFPIRSFT